MKLQDILEATKTNEHVKGGLDSFYQLTKAKRLAKADGHDYDKLPEYDRGKDQPHKEKYMALAKEVNEGEERTDIKDLMIPKIKEYLHSKGPGSYISLEDLESDLYDYARQLTHDDLKSSDDLRNFMSNPGDEASSAVGELLSGMYKAEFDDYITTEGRIEDTFGTKTIDKHDKPRKKGKRVDEFVPAIPAILTGLRLLGPIILRHATKDAIKKAVVGKVGGEAVKKAVVQGAKGTANVTKDVIKKAGPVAGKVGKEIGKKAVGPAVGGAVVVGGVSYLVDQVFDKIEEAIQFLSDLFGDLFDMETLKKIADMLVKYGLPIAGILAVAYGGKVLVDYIRSEGDEPEEYDDELIREAETNMIGEPDSHYDAEARTDAHDDLQDALTGGWEDQYITDGVCPNCAGTGYQDAEDEVYNDETDEYEEGNECDGWGQYGCDEGEMQGATWKEIIAFDQQNVDRQKAKDNYPGDEAVIDFAASTAKQLKKSGQDPRDTLEYVKNEYPSMGRAQRASLVAKGMKKAGLTSEGKSPHKKGSAKYKNHMAAKHASMGENMNEQLKIEKIKNNKGEIIQYTILNGEPFDVNGAPLEYGPYWDIMIADGHSDIEINSHMWPDYDKRNKDVAGYEGIQAGDELMIETGMGEGVIAPVIHVVGENVLLAWDETADSLFEETEEIDEGEKHGNSKIYNKCWKGYRKVPGKSAGEKGSCKKNEDIEENTKDPESKGDCESCHGTGYKDGNWSGKSCPVCDGDGEEPGFGGTKAYEEIERMRHLAGLDEGDIEMYAKPDQVKKAVQDIIKNGFATSGKFINWCKDNNCTFTLDLKDPKNLQKIAIAKLNFEKATGYGTDGEILNRKPPLQKELELTPGVPRQKEFDFESIEEAEYQGRKVKLGKPTRGDVKKFKVYVKDPKTGNVKKVNFGHGGTSAKKAGQKTMKIKKSNPARRKSFRARHNCDNPGPRTKARYWSCRAW